MNDEARRRRIENALEDILDDGESWFVTRQAGRVEALPSEQAAPKPLGDEKPELYGHLLSVNEILSDSGTGVIFCSLFVVAGICLAVHMEWIDTLFRVPVEKFQSVWVYAFALAGAFFGAGQAALWMEGLAYRRQRRRLLESIDEAGFTLWGLLARISGDEDLSKVAERLKTEGAGRTP